jgi:hypothetical protein
MKFTICLLLSFFMSYVGYSQSTESIKNNISKVLSDQQVAWNRGDLESFMAGYWKSDSLTFVGSRGLTYGWESTLKNYKATYPDKGAMGQLNFEIIKFDLLSSDAAVMIGRYTLIRAKDKPTGLFTLIWKKINGQWVITSDQTCG